jgi:ABC-type nitrate/sulfonate/bicarbonate transport system substrate-binding protein
VQRVSRRSFLRMTGSALLALLASPQLARPSQPLRVSFPLSVDSYPLKYGINQGIFERNGLTIEPLTMRGATERRLALASGELDCIVDDISTVIFGVANAQQSVVVTSTAFEMVNGGRALLLLGSGSNYMDIQTTGDLLGGIDSNWRNSIALTARTDVEYATDELLEQLSAEVNPRYAYLEAADHVLAFEHLIFGKVMAAVLPEPLATMATERNSIPNGGILQPGDWAFVLSDYREIKIMPSIILFRKELLKTPDRIQRFYRAYRETIDVLNETPEEASREIAIEIGQSMFAELYGPALGEWYPPEGFEELLDIPYFPQPRVLEQEGEFEVIVQWALQKGYIRSGRVPPYDEVVDPNFVG